MLKEERPNFQFEGRIVLFATNNVNKFSEARRALKDYGLAVGMIRLKSLEIQSESLQEIAKTSVEDVFSKIKLPVIVEDAGLFIDALNGFPGPYAAYAYKTIGNSGLLKLMKNVDSRKATFESNIACMSPKLTRPICFVGTVNGQIVKHARKKNENSGFGFDPIFAPEKSELTFAEMSTEEKNRYSHRAKALRKYASWYKKQRVSNQ